MRHAAVAEAIAAAEPERLDEHAGLLAHHWSEAGDAPRASGWRIRAARWVRANDLVASRRHWTQARRLRVALPDSSERTQLLLDVYPELINTLDRLGAEPAEAEAVYVEAVDIARRSGDRRTEGLVEAAYAYLKSGQNDFPGVIEHARRAVALADARVLRMIGGPEDQIDLEAQIAEAFDLFQRADMKSWFPLILLERAGFARLRGDADAMARDLAEARRLFAEMGVTGWDDYARSIEA